MRRLGVFMRRRIMDILMRIGSAKPSREPRRLFSEAGSPMERKLNPWTPSATPSGLPSMSSTAKPEAMNWISSSKLRSFFLSPAMNNS